MTLVLCVVGGAVFASRPRQTTSPVVTGIEPTIHNGLRHRSRAKPVPLGGSASQLVDNVADAGALVHRAFAIVINITGHPLVRTAVALVCTTCRRQTGRHGEVSRICAQISYVRIDLPRIDPRPEGVRGRVVAVAAAMLGVAQGSVTFPFAVNVHIRPDHPHRPGTRTLASQHAPNRGLDRVGATEVHGHHPAIVRLASIKNKSFIPTWITGPQCAIVTVLLREPRCVGVPRERHRYRRITKDHGFKSKQSGPCAYKFATLRALALGLHRVAPQSGKGHSVVAFIIITRAVGPRVRLRAAVRCTIRALSLK